VSLFSGMRGYNNNTFKGGESSKEWTKLPDGFKCSRRATVILSDS